jgi:uncharacterized membrane protein YhhN
MNYTLLTLALIFAVIEWIAVEKHWKSIEYFAKPAVMIVLIIWFWQNGGFQDWMIWFGLGAVFSLVGDIFLMLPRKFFLAGLISFLIAQLVYLVGFNRSFPPITAIGAVIFLILLMIAWQFYIRLAAGLKAKNLNRLTIPTLIYVIVISLMTLSAIFTLFREEWSIVSALLVSGGAILFFISDAINAWDRFIKPFPGARLKTMIAYYLAQAGIMIGAVLQQVR